MSVSAPHFLLFSEASRAVGDGRRRSGQWRFVLESVDGGTKLAAADEEPQARGNRLELLAVVRGLEALDQPSRVTLVTPSRYVSRGIRYGLREWRRNGWRWERFGEMAPVRNRDLWRRVDRALRYHRVECRTWRFDSPEDDLAGSARVVPRPERAGWSESAGSDGAGGRRKSLLPKLIRHLGAFFRPPRRRAEGPFLAAAG